MAKVTDLRELLRWDDSLPDPDSTPGAKGLSKGPARAEIAAMAPELAELQEKLFANGKRGGKQRVLLVLQGMDAGGKDGAVKHVVGQVNPAGVRITSFSAPTEEELSHDFLWRMERALPTVGEIGVFNRSHYEDVLVVRVHELVPRAVWSRRYQRINTWERQLAASGCTVVKVFLHLSKDEQQQRLLARLEDPSKHWKISAADITERGHWDDYQAAYLAALSKCSTDAAPWYVVPADRKWYRDWAISHLLLETLHDLDLSWPTAGGLDLVAMRQELLDT